MAPVAWGLVLAFGCAAPTDRAGGGPSPGAVFEIAGLDAHARAFGDALVRASRDAPSDDVDPDVLAVVRGRADALARGDALVHQARARFETRVDPGPARATLSFFDSPTGRRLRAMETGADDVLGDEETVDRFVDALFSEPVDLDRVRRLERLAGAARADELATGIQAHAERAVARAVRDAGPRLDAALHVIDEKRRYAAARWRVRSIVLLQLVYRDATDAELDAYAAFAESAAGSWLARASLSTMADLEDWTAEALSTDARDTSPGAGSAPAAAARPGSPSSAPR